MFELQASRVGVFRVKGLFGYDKQGRLTVRSHGDVQILLDTIPFSRDVQWRDLEEGYSLVATPDTVTKEGTVLAVMDVDSINNEVLFSGNL